MTVSWPSNDDQFVLTLLNNDYSVICSLTQGNDLDHGPSGYDPQSRAGCLALRSQSVSKRELSNGNLVQLETDHHRAPVE